MTGVIDLLCAEPDGAALIVDYKSDRLAGRGRSGGSSWSATTACSDCCTRSRCLREGAAAVEVVHWFLERPDEPAVARYTPPSRATLEDGSRDGSRAPVGSRSRYRRGRTGRCA